MELETAKESRLISTQYLGTATVQHRIVTLYINPGPLPVIQSSRLLVSNSFSLEVITTENQYGLNNFFVFLSVSQREHIG